MIIIENAIDNSENNSDNDDNDNASDNDENNYNDCNGNDSKLAVDSPHKGPIMLSFDILLLIL